MNELVTIIACTLLVIAICAVTCWLTPEESDKPGIKIGPGGDFTKHI